MPLAGAAVDAPVFHMDADDDPLGADWGEEDTQLFEKRWFDLDAASRLPSARPKSLRPPSSSERPAGQRRAALIRLAQSGVDIRGTGLVVQDFEAAAASYLDRGALSDDDGTNAANQRLAEPPVEAGPPDEDMGPEPPALGVLSRLDARFFVSAAVPSVLRRDGTAATVGIDYYLELDFFRTLKGSVPFTFGAFSVGSHNPVLSDGLVDPSVLRGGPP